MSSKLPGFSAEDNRWDDLAKIPVIVSEVVRSLNNGRTV